MVETRTERSKAVRFDNGVGLVRNTQGRLVREDREQRARSPAPLRQPEPTGEEEEGEEAATESSSSSEDEEVPAPIVMKLELRFIADGMKGAPAGKLMDMSCWQQPGNELRENARFTLELSDIKQRARTWLDEYCWERPDVLDGTLREISAIVSCRGTSKNPYHFSLDGGEDLDSYKSMYEKIKQLHSEKARDIRAIVSQYFKLHFRERTPQPSASQSQSQSQTPSSQPRSSQKRARAETATNRQNRAREAVRDVDRLTGNHTTAI